MLTSKKIGKCIYCGKVETRLSTEHVVPYGLNGTWTLSEASCEDCAKITSKIEMHALRNIFHSARASYNLRTRRKLPDTFTAIGLKNGNEVKLTIATKDFGAVICLLGYNIPAYLSGNPYKTGIDVSESYLIRTNGKDLKELGKELGISEISFRTNFQGNVFERFIAKIAYCFCIYQFGVDGLESKYILPAILGEKDDIGMWLGSVSPTVGSEDLEISLDVNPKNEVICKIRLFGKLPVPTYIVVVGKLK